MSHTHTPKTLESASVMCSLQSNIYSAQNYSKYLPLLSRSKHMRGGKTVPATQWLGSSQSLYWGWSHNNMFCDQCSSLLVPRRWSRLSDITTLSSRLPTCALAPEAAQTAIVSLMSFCLWFQTLDTFLQYFSVVQAARGIIYIYAPMSSDPLRFHVN